ncbi:hypothetical protein BDAP_001842 [Binucleata daphniae]
MADAPGITTIGDSSSEHTPAKTDLTILAEAITKLNIQTSSMQTQTFDKYSGNQLGEKTLTWLEQFEPYITQWNTPTYFKFIKAHLIHSAKDWFIGTY